MYKVLKVNEDRKVVRITILGDKCRKNMYSLQPFKF